MEERKKNNNTDIDRLIDLERYKVHENDECRKQCRKQCRKGCRK